MECIEARALKSSFLSSQMADSEVFYNDDVWCLTRINSVASDDFPVEDLLNLDFSDKDGSFFEDYGASDKGDSNGSSSSSSFSGTDEFDNLSAGEISLPVEDLENLEWLSQFVDDSQFLDDSTSEFSLLYSAGSFSAASSVQAGSRPPPSFPSMVPSKARSKRPRPRPSRTPWSSASPPLAAVADSPTPSSSHSSSTFPPLAFINAEAPAGVENPASKKLKRKPESEAAGFISGRRCTHCQVQKTPQWRTGPLGPKTLCNACGVRFKSGRLFPEYRPACSPTYSQEVHSNSHRKVLEMRRRKEMDEPVLERSVQCEGL